MCALEETSPTDMEDEVRVAISDLKCALSAWLFRDCRNDLVD